MLPRIKKKRNIEKNKRKSVEMSETQRDIVPSIVENQLKQLS